MDRGQLIEALLAALGEPQKPQRPAQRPRSLDNPATYKRLLEPFPLGSHEVRPGAAYNGRALVLPYVDWHGYQARLDEVAGPSGWGVEFLYFSEAVVKCRLSILGVVKEDIGEAEEGGEGPRKGANPVFGGVAQSFRRACAAFGLGRYLYALPPFFAPLEGGGRKFAGDLAQLVEELFSKAGMLPAQRLAREIAQARTMEDIEYLGEAIARAGASGDLTPKEKEGLRAPFKARREEVTKAFVAGEAPPAPAPRRAPQPPAPPAAPEERERSPQASDTPAPEWGAQGGGAWKDKGSPGGDKMRPDLEGGRSPAPASPASPEERQRRAAAALDNARVVRTAATPAPAPAGEGGGPVANVPSARAARWISDLDGIKTFQDHAAFNEAILKEHAKNQFDATDFRLLEEAAAARYKLLQRKEKLLQGDPAF